MTTYGVGALAQLAVPGVADASSDTECVPEIATISTYGPSTAAAAPVTVAGTPSMVIANDPAGGVEAVHVPPPSTNRRTRGSVDRRRSRRPTTAEASNPPAHRSRTPAAGLRRGPTSAGAYP